MTVPSKTFTGVSGKGLGGTNGAGTVTNGGLQRDITTCFAMFNPEATRPDGQPGGIQKENLASNIWDGFLDDHIATENKLGMVSAPSEFIDNTGMLQFGGLLKLHADSGWQINSTANSNIVWNQQSAEAVYTLTFPTPLSSLTIPYFSISYSANNANGDGLSGGGSGSVFDFTLTCCKKVTSYYRSVQTGPSTIEYRWSSVGSYFRILIFKIV